MLSPSKLIPNSKLIEDFMAKKQKSLTHSILDLHLKHHEITLEAFYLRETEFPKFKIWSSGKNSWLRKIVQKTSDFSLNFTTQSQASAVKGCPTPQP